MPVKKAAPATAKKVTAKNKAPAKGDKLVCETCGLGVLVDDVDGVVAFEELICCGQPMKAKKPAARRGPMAKKPPKK